MIFKSFLLASAFSAVAFCAAEAADVVVEQEPAPVAVVAPPAFSWSGAYVGGQVGYGWGKTRFNDGVFSQSLKPGGFVGGVYAGYNFSVGQHGVVGVDGDLAYNNQKDRQDIVSASGFTSALESRLRWSGAVRARVGVAMDRVMPYIAGGVAFGGVKNAISTAQFSATSSKTLTGWTAGAGLEYAATDNTILRVEYRYTDFGKKDFDFGTGVNVHDSTKSNEVRLGVAYKF